MKTTKTTKLTKSTKKPQAINLSPVRRVAIGALLVLLILFITAQLVLDLAMVRRLNSGDTAVVTQLITQSIDGMHKPATVEPRSGETYIRDAKLVLPAAQWPNDQLLYTYNVSDDTPAELNVTTKQATTIAKARLWSMQVNDSGWDTNPTTVFEQVPEAQACARGALVVFDAKTADRYDVKPENTKQLKDGRTMYIATHDVANCRTGLDKIVDYLKQAESY